jgi:(1->4)-alpha-D-glucan 1-alpha-D-glucosylmutase
LKLVAPGVCDVYQGTELWDLSLVDPDNRRPVDFTARAGMLARIDAELARDPSAALASLRERWADGGIKLAVLARGLAARAERSELFVQGEVLRVVAGGARAARVCAVGRRHADQWALAVVARATCGLVEDPVWAIGAKVWDGTTVLLPDGAPTRWRDAVTGIAVNGDGGRLALERVLCELPCALLVAE